jgi:hypothetical protein
MNKLQSIIVLTFILFGWSESALAQSDTLVRIQPEYCKVTPMLSPNSDDPHIYVSCDGSVDSFSFKLFNRWGQIVYETKTHSEPLDFRAFEIVKKKYLIPSGTYFYSLTYSNPLIDTPELSHQTGSITISH